MRALGLAALSQQGNGPSCSLEARSKYISAIHLVNSAIGTPNLARQDSTLQAINVLSIFEAITGFNRSLDSWRDHVNGAGALLQLRGPEQFATETGGRLFIQASQMLTICCIHRHLPIPRHIWDMMRYAETCLPEPIGSGFLFHKATMRFADLYSRLHVNHEPLVVADAEDIIHEALALEAEFNHIETHAPESWQFDVAFASGPLVFAGYYYIYRSALAAQMMNSIRSYRIALRDIMYKAVEQCTELESVELSQVEVENLFFPRVSIHELQQQILASIPQHLGTTLSSHQTSSVQTVDSSGRPVLWPDFHLVGHNPFSFRGSKSPDIPFVRMAGGYLLQWPLYTAGMASAPGSSLRIWVIDTLRFIGKSAGVKQALLLASKLEGNKNQFMINGGARFEAWKAKYAIPQSEPICCTLEAFNIDQPVWSTVIS
ncbi:Hypothetical protein R9X50_00355400 [Acrodontium crateriforme]|uniref:Uncharacterized protein n=1 Tax=Acrodontium crateriforme TaxID=150365 RepID=A0AAQ3M369_9PEZI|nr:Hypothetical protein R9X50_00355400 [Acrodontium crateriforme]